MEKITKSFKRVLFCIPPFPPKTYEWPQTPHTGVGYLSTFLEKHGIETDVMDMRLGYHEKDLLKKAEEVKPDLVGVSFMTYGRDMVPLIVRALKEAGYSVVIGGPHVSTVRAQALEEYKADFAVKQEGEYTLLELCEGKDYKTIDGLVYKEDDRIIENKDRPLIENLDDIPYPTYERFELAKYKSGVMGIVSSRGCPYRCIYCNAHQSMGRGFRERSAKNVVGEIEYWYKRGYRHFGLADDNFTFNRSRIFEICDLIEEKKLDIRLYCPNGVRADRVDREMLKRMKEVGFVQLAIGVEAGTNKVLKNIKKGETIEVIEEAIKTACDLGFDTRLYFLVGSPSESLSDVQKSIDLALRYPVSDARFYNLIPYPGTELYNWVEANDYFVRYPKEYLAGINIFGDEPVFQTPEFPLEERKKALEITRNVRDKVQKRYLKSTLVKKYGKIGHFLFFFLRFDIIKGLVAHMRYEKAKERMLIH